MKKIIICILILFTLWGCDNNARKLDEEKYNTYLLYYQSILDSDSKKEKSQCFDFSLAVNQIGENLYRYDIIIDNPRVAMYEIKALAVIDNLTIEVDKNQMMPSVGILDNKNYNMIPFQVDTEKDFVSGIVLSLTSEQSALRISVMIECKDSSGLNYVREYLSIYGEYVPNQE
ncbi:MAG: hypothetical protein Q4C64_00675 [Erysipelotrichia bacterium]|nr:hypothetical protein [Erysipelotrichia bacterium]